MEKSFKELVEDGGCMGPLSEIHEELGLNCHAWDTLGKPILPAMWGNTLCKAIKSVKPGLLTCAGSHKEITKEAKSTGLPTIKMCHAGLIKAVVPVMRNGRYIGMIGGCGGVPKGVMVDEGYLRELAATIGLSGEELVECAKTVSEVDESDLMDKVNKALDGIEKAASVSGEG